MKVLVIDNYDSFTYNLVYILREALQNVSVFRNNKITPEACLQYHAIVLSPGPGIPKNAGNLTAIIETCAGKIPILGICLGHQAIGEYLGATLVNMSQVYHGVATTVTTINNSFLFKNTSKTLKVGLYHSWKIDETSVNQDIEVIAIAKNNTIMAIQNTSKKLFGIQFHPESILTPQGTQIILNFLEFCTKENS